METIVHCQLSIDLIDFIDFHFSLFTFHFSFFIFHSKALLLLLSIV